MINLLIKYAHLIKLQMKTFVLLILLSVQPSIYAAELLTDLGGDSGFGQLAMGRNDDGSSVQIDITQAFPEGWNFFGSIYGLVYINNNGNITFNNRVGAFTPTPFPISSQPMIAPFWGDVDTRGGTPTGESEFSNNVYYSFEKAGSFVVTWFNVGYYSAATNKLNTFQLILTDRSDTGDGALGNFDVEFRYGRLEWTTGGASGGSNGLGGTPAQVGFDAGDGTNFFAHPDSRTADILDLIHSSNVGIDGIWRFEVRDGVVTEPPVLTDVTLKLFLPKYGITIDETTFEEPPVSISVLGDERVVEWQFDAFTVTRLKDMSFDVFLNDPVPGETRIISHRMELSYKDVNDNLVVQNIGEKVVEVLPSILNISVDTDKEIYIANEGVTINSLVDNLSDFDAVTDLKLTIYDEIGTLVEEVELFVDEMIPASGNKPLTSVAFNTSTILVGNYVVQAELIDSSGQTYATATAPFSIQSSISGDLLASLRLATDKPIYNTSDTVNIESLSRNITENTLLSVATVKIKVSNPDGSTYVELEQNIGELAAGSSRELNSTHQLSSVVEGSYTVVGELLDASQNILATAQTSFLVEESRELTIVGSLQVTSDVLDVGDTQYCLNTISNEGTLSLDNAFFRQVLVNIDTEATTTFTEQQMGTIATGDSYQFTSEINTNDLEVGPYSCILQRQTEDGWKTLAFKFFELEISINIASDFSINSDNMRLLILVDGAGDCVNTETGCSANEIKDPLGPDSAPSVIEQQAALESLLNSQGWSYTIVTTADDFKRELRSGTYTAYALFSEQVKLDKSTQEELREAVFKGEGLLIAGDHDHRNNHLDDTLGVKVTGKESAPGSLNVIEVEDYSAMVTDLILLDKTRHIQLLDAEMVANYTGTSRIAVTNNDYGFGHSVYAGFDVLAHLAMPSSDTVMKDILIAMLKDIQPEATMAYLTDSVIPIQLQLENLGVSTPGEAHIAQPEGITFVDAGKGVIQEDGSLVWVFNLEKEETSVLDFWIKLPSEPTTLTLDAILKTGIEPLLDDYEILNLSIPVSAAPTLDDVLDTVVSLQMSNKDFKQVTNALKKAASYESQGKLDKALSESLKAVDALLRIDSPEVKSIRQDLAISLRYLEMQLP